MEPKLLKVNGLDKLNRIFGTDYTDEDGLRKYMKHNKTECALRKENATLLCIDVIKSVVQIFRSGIMST